ncbi:MAG TPA: DsbC family protein, partial [Leucothrix sp.]|nr:DsbC family protein [Leucothrix sp.]
MIKKTILNVSITGVLLFSAFATTQAEVSNTAKDDVLTSLKTILKTKLRAEPSSLKESVIPNMYEAIYGTEVVYVSADGKYFISGDLIDLDTRKNLSDIA